VAEVWKSLAFPEWDRRSRPLFVSFATGAVLWVAAIAVGEFTSSPVAVFAMSFYAGGLWWLWSIRYVMSASQLTARQVTRYVVLYGLLMVPAVVVTAIGPDSMLFLTACLAAVPAVNGLIYLIRERSAAALWSWYPVIFGLLVATFALVLTFSLSFAVVMAAATWLTMGGLVTLSGLRPQPSA
jgi:hypothetical protein